MVNYFRKRHLQAVFVLFLGDDDVMQFLVEAYGSNGESGLKCTLCGKFGRFKHNLKRHMILKHTKPTVLKYGINPQVKCSGKNDIISNLGFPRLVKNHQTVLKLADILNRKWQMFNFLCTSR